MSNLTNQLPKPVWLLAILGVVLFYNLGSWGVTETSEARYAEIAWEMYRSGDYTHPRLLGIGHFHKPPLTYWVTALAYGIFGVSAFAARFFLQLALLVQVWLVFRIGRLLFESRSVAFRACLIYASFPAVIIGTRGLTTDMYLATWVLLFIWAWLAFKRTGQRYYVLIAYTALGFGFLSKGPVVLIVPLAAAWAINKLILETKAAGWLHALGGGLMLLVGGGWFIQLYTENSQFLDYFLLDHTVNRFATNQFGRSKPFWYYLVLVPVLAFPWFLMVVLPQFKKLRPPFGLPLLFFCWVILPLVFFSLSQSKLVLYVLPLFPGTALAAAWQWSELRLEVQKKWMMAFAVFAGIVVIGLLVAPLVDQSLRFTPMMYGLIALLAVLILALVFIRRDSSDKLPWASFAFTMVLTVWATHFFTNNAAMVRDQRPVARYLQDRYAPDTPILVYNKRLPSLAFAMEKDIVSLYDGDRNLVRETQFETDQRWRKTLINLKEEPLPAYGSGSVLVAKAQDALPSGFRDYLLDTTLDGWNIYVKSSGKGTKATSCSFPAHFKN